MYPFSAACSALHTASRVIETKGKREANAMVQAFSWCPELLWGLLEMPPPKARPQRPLGMDLANHPPTGLTPCLLCFLPGPALCGPSDSDAVLHLCGDWDAGRTAGLLLPCLPFLFPPPSPMFPDTSLLLLTVPPSASTSEAKNFTGIRISLQMVSCR